MRRRCALLACQQADPLVLDREEDAVGLRPKRDLDSSTISENFTALLSRLSSTCSSRKASAHTWVALRGAFS